MLRKVVAPSAGSRAGSLACRGRRRLVPGPAGRQADKMLAIRRGSQMPDRPRSDSEDSEEFARMLEEASAPKSHREGETVEGIIVAIGGEVAFVDIGGERGGGHQHRGLVGPA